MMMKSAILVFVVLAVLLVPTVQAFNQTCTNDVLTKELSITANGETTLITMDEDCPYGCADPDPDTGLSTECNQQAPSDFFFAVAIAFSMIAFMFAYLSVKFSEDHWALQILFIMTAIGFVIIDVFVIAGYSTLTGNNINDILLNGYNIGVWAILLVATYFIVLFLYNLLLTMTEKRKSKKQRWS